MTPSWSRSQSRRNSWRCFSFLLQDSIHGRLAGADVRFRRFAPLGGARRSFLLAMWIRQWHHSSSHRPRRTSRLCCQALHEGASPCILWSSHWHSEWCSIHEHTVETELPKTLLRRKRQYGKLCRDSGKGVLPDKFFQAVPLFEIMVGRRVFSKVSGDV